MKRGAGVVLPLFSLRSGRDYGIGEILDLPLACRWAKTGGFSWVQVLPPQELGGDETSPYGARSAFALDPTYLTLDALPGVTSNLVAEVLGTSGLRERDELRAEAKVHYADVRRLKRKVLDAAVARFVDHQLAVGGSEAEAFTRFCEAEADWLEPFVSYVARWNQQGKLGWRTWPADAPAPAEADLRAERVKQFFLRSQWRQAQREREAIGVKLMGDVPFILGTESADVWANQDVFRFDKTLGAPPDPFSADGQDWSLPAFDFDALAAANHAWLRRRTRVARELFDAFRLDHVVGYFRMWLWTHADGARQGAFDIKEERAQAARGRRLLAIMQEESGPDALIAEDLGVIPDFVREALRDLGIPGYRVLPWERDERGLRDPKSFPSRSVATYSTHDTAPIGAWWADFSADEQRELAELAGFDPAVDARERHLGLMRLLCNSSSELVLVLFEEVLARTGRINVPGTVGPHNWSLRLHRPLEELLRDPASQALMDAFRRIVVETGREP
jgi:4-alpha-glucanotransferase